MLGDTDSFTLERMIFQMWCPMLLRENQTPTTEACKSSSAVRPCTLESRQPNRSTRISAKAVAYKEGNRPDNEWTEAGLRFVVFTVLKGCAHQTNFIHILTWKAQMARMNLPERSLSCGRKE